MNDHLTARWIAAMREFAIDCYGEPATIFDKDELIAALGTDVAAMFWLDVRRHSISHTFTTA